ncbi:MAG: hypothetical protein Q8K28_06685 [Hoeflea sp.]|uniref:hypothetical protein n=1 Tax=Hoeflea sp. TaxID=1940281 RepID=UPI00273173B4|nr:hypothetical protein [Hoeflea sp.]MDP2119572.1 hypothetical protein [Hoeflea sp.]
MKPLGTAKTPPNYLTKLAREEEMRRWERRNCAVLVNILFPLKGIRQISKAQLRVLNISEGGLMATSRRLDIPDFFYISIGKAQYHIGCVVIFRENGVIRASFLKEQPTVFINVFASLMDPFALLAEIRPALYGLEGEV